MQTLLDFFAELAGHAEEFLVYDDGYRSWSYRYSDVARAASQVAAGRTGELAEARSQAKPGVVAGPAELRLIDSSEMAADLRDADECH